MDRHYDVVIIGLGAMGSAAYFQLAKRKKRVLALDKFFPPHQFGSSSGSTRITRQAIGEGAIYTPLALRSYEIWRELEQYISEELPQYKSNLLTITGGLIIDRPLVKSLVHGAIDFLGETIKAAKQFGIEYESLNSRQLKIRFPQFNYVGDEQGYYEPMAGFLRPENCIRSQIAAGINLGGSISLGEEVTDVIPSPDGNRVTVKTSLSREYTAEKVIISAGPWINRFLPEKLRSLFEIHRQVLYWFDMNRRAYGGLKDSPIFIKVNDFMYGFPPLDGPDGGMKIASEVADKIDPDHMSQVTQKEIDKIYKDKVKNFIPDLDSTCLKAVTCKYTETPDRHFVIDHYPGLPQVIIASPCSGHGFKHSAAIGEVLAQMTIDGESTLDISPFSLNRFKV